MKRSIHWYLLFILILLGGIAVYLLDANNVEKVTASSQQRLEYTHNRAVAQFSSSVERMGGLVAGMKSYINMSETLPSQDQFQRFIQNQLDDIHSTDSIVVSVIDTSHIFKQSFTRYENDPVHLIGTSLKEFRAQEKIDALDALMQMDGLKMFPPINIKEGWLGIPINFRIYRKGNIEGYVAPILNFASIMSSVYDPEINKDFVFKFSSEGGIEFDRTRAYNGTVVYNDKVDEEFYRNFEISEESFIATTNDYFGFTITIATAYKKPLIQSNRYRSFLFIGYGIFGLVLFVITWQVDRYLRLNTRLELANNEIASKNKELESLNQTKNKFFSMISHDVKQPLQSIETLLGYLQDERTEDPSANVLFNAIRKSTRNTVSLLNNLLKWALSQTGELTFDPVVFDLNQEVQGVISLLDQQALAKSITIAQDLKGHISFNGDVDMIRTVFRNLISNAIKFTDPEGTIVIISSIHDNEIRILIKDDGVGMKPELTASLFQIGEMVSREGTAGEIGTGLGLILCKDFVEKHHGRIEVVSKLEGGTTFTVVLPVIIAD